MHNIRINWRFNEKKYLYLGTPTPCALRTPSPEHLLVNMSLAGSLLHVSNSVSLVYFYRLPAVSLSIFCLLTVCYLSDYLHSFGCIYAACLCFCLMYIYLLYLLYIYLLYPLYSAVCLFSDNCVLSTIRCLPTDCQLFVCSHSGVCLSAICFLSTLCWLYGCSLSARSLCSLSVSSLHANCLLPAFLLSALYYLLRHCRLLICCLMWCSCVLSACVCLLSVAYIYLMYIYLISVYYLMYVYCVAFFVFRGLHKVQSL